MPRKNIMWTVEWIEPGNTRCISNNHNEKQSVIEAYLYGTDKASTKKRKREDEDIPPAKKGATATTDGKERDGPSKVDASKGGDLESKPEATLGIAHSEIGESGTSTEDLNLQPDTANSRTPASKGNEADSHPERPSTTKEDEPQSKHTPEVPVTEQKEQGEQVADAEVTKSTYYFFLHKPRTTSTRPVLIRITPSSTLHDALRGRTVLEFPTIYVFTSPAPPPEGFTLEAAYLEQEKQEQQELEEALKSVQPGTLPGPHDEGTGQQGESGADEFDSKRILDVLKRDLGAGL
jgi:hypothetical protein